MEILDLSDQDQPPPWMQLSLEVILFNRKKSNGSSRDVDTDNT